MRTEDKGVGVTDPPSNAVAAYPWQNVPTNLIVLRLSRCIVFFGCLIIFTTLMIWINTQYLLAVRCLLRSIALKL